MTDQCDNCKTGIAQLSDYKAWKKDKTIHYYELLIRLKNHGSRCVSCMYNGINPKSKKAKVYCKIPKLHFQQLDMFEPIDVNMATLDMRDCHGKGVIK